LLETLALLEDECDEWQNAKRKSLDTITNQNTTPEAIRHKNFKTPRQQLANSVRRLRAMESQLKGSCHKKSLVSAFDHEVDSSGPPQGEMEALQQELEELKKELHSKTAVHDKQIQMSKKDIFKWEQECSVMSSKLQAAKAEKKKYDDSIHKDAREKRALLNRVDQLRKDLTVKHDELQEAHQTIATMESQNDWLTDSHEQRIDGLTQDLHIAENTTMEMHVQLLNQFHQGKSSELLFKDQIASLSGQIDGLQCRLTSTERCRDDLKMQLAIEKHSKLSTGIKLDSARFFLEKQAAVITTLTKNLSNARSEANAHANDSKQLTHKLKLAQAEATEALKDRNESLRHQRMELAMFKDTFGECIMGA
jgi:chromosome segregation ATPase